MKFEPNRHCTEKEEATHRKHKERLRKEERLSKPRCFDYIASGWWIIKFKNCKKAQWCKYSKYKEYTHWDDDAGSSSISQEWKCDGYPR